MKKNKTKKRRIKEIPGVIKAISIIDYIYGGLLLFVAIILFLGGTLIGSVSTMMGMFPHQLLGGLLGGVALFLSLIIALVGILYIYLGNAIKKYKLWAKITQIILAVFTLFSFPVGTAIAPFTFWVLLINKETKEINLNNTLKNFIEGEKKKKKK